MANGQPRKQIPAKIKALLQQEIDSRCPFCNNTEVDHFQTHHIDGNRSNDEYVNLIMLCAICHSKATKGDIPMSQVRQKKLYLMNRKPQAPKKQSSVVTFNARVNNAIVGDHNTINIKQPKKEKYPTGCVGGDNIRANYVGYLIKQYNEYKSKEIGKENMAWGLFGKKLKKKFGIGPTRTIYNVPMTRFDELVSYIHSEIDGTWLARIKRGKSQLKNYDSLDEYTQKYS